MGSFSRLNKQNSRRKGSLGQKSQTNLPKILLWAILKRRSQNTNRRLQLITILGASQLCATTMGALVPGAAPVLTHERSGNSELMHL